MSSDNAPLSQLAQSLMDGDSAYSMDHSAHAHSGHAAHAHSGHSAHGWWSFVFYFLLVAVIFYFLYFALRPSFVLKQDHCDDSYSRSYSDEHYEEIDNGRLLASAVVSALLLIFVLWLFAWGFSGSM